MSATVVLTSDFPSTANYELAALIRATSPSPRVAWIPPSSSAGRGKFSAAQDTFRSIGVEHLEFWETDWPDVANPPSLDRYDVVYLTGGDPILFRQRIHRTRLAVRLREFFADGRLVVGASGGAMQLTANVSLFRLLSASVDEVIANRAEFNGLGALDCELLPHLNRHDVSFLEKVRRYSELISHDIVALPDGAGMVLDNGESRYIGEAVLFSDGGQKPVK